jgi:hypothetical protein
MPDSLCLLLESNLIEISADCAEDLCENYVRCDCCTTCWPKGDEAGAPCPSNVSNSNNESTTSPSPSEGVLTPSLSPTMAAATSAPTSELLAEIMSVLNDEPTLSTSQVLEDPSSPEFKAAVWLSSNNNTADIGVLSLDNPTFLQRYALVCFYYSTGGPDWKFCGESSPSCGDVQWLTPGAHECNWFSVDCTNDMVVNGLNFPGTYLL